jgi:RNA polymerase sigma-70 factor, ECF subfamily
LAETPAEVAMNDLSARMVDMNDSDVSVAREECAYVYAVIRRILRSDDAASDATQDALLLVHRHRDQFRGDAALRTWLYRIAVTTALGVLRKARRSREQLAPDLAPLGWDVADPAPSPEQEVAVRELADRAAAELAKLGEIYRGVFELKAGEWVEREIARELDISIPNVKIRAHRVRQHLRGLLGDEALTRRAPAARRPRPGTRAGRIATSRAS